MDANIGRWPANVILDEDAARTLDAQAGFRRSGGFPKRRHSAKFSNTFNGFTGHSVEEGRKCDSGGASRFFYCAKASRSEREAGLSLLPKTVESVFGGEQNDLSVGKKAVLPARNHHPTVKPIALMRYLCRLVTPPSGTVLDPLAGSGSTGIAGLKEGFNFLGIELNPEYAELARRRIAHAQGPLFAEKGCHE
jgi:site-specific DNA-methyltransferase (adenine-specific)